MHILTKTTLIHQPHSSQTVVVDMDPLFHLAQMCFEFIMDIISISVLINKT